MIGANLPIYHIDRVIAETNEKFDDEAHIIYINSQIQDETELGKLMQDFYCTDAKEMHYSILAERVRYFKENQEGVRIMCKAMEDMREEAEREKINEMIVSMHENGLADELIAKIAKVSIEYVQKILAVAIGNNV